MKALLSTLTLLATLSLSIASSSGTLTFDQAKQLAAQQNKPILLEFSGSDWCPPCKMLQKQTLDTPAFQKFASENLIFLQVDFPRYKQLSREVQDHNDKLAATFGVRAYPTLVLLNSQAGEIARSVGFLPGGPQALISWINQHTKK